MVGSPVIANQNPGDGQATIRLLFLTALINALPDGGARIDSLLREHGVVRSQLAAPYERVPLHRYISLIEHAAQKFDRPYLGLEMGRLFDLAELGPFHALLRAAGNLRGALDYLVLFQSRFQTRTLLDSEVGQETTTYSYRIEDQKIWPRRQDAEFVITGFVTLIKQLTTPKWVPVQVRFEHSIAGRKEHLGKFFQAPVVGNQVANQLVILNDNLDRPFPGAIPSQDQKLKSILECHLLNLMGPEIAPTKDIVSQTREIIARWLGRTHVDCASVAAELNLSERSFRRRLMEEGASFRSLLQETRQARARVMLESTDLRLSAAAEQLGYSDIATFSRAFKEWTGVSPRRFLNKTP
jgi:AraC-like DNA-binding protein